MRWIMALAIALTLTSCATVKAYNDWLNRETTRVRSTFVGDVTLEYLDRQGDWIPSSATYYDVYLFRAGVHFVAPPDTRIVSLSARLDGNPIGCDANHYLILPGYRDRQHILTADILLKPLNGDVVPKSFRITVDFHSTPG